MQSYEEKYQQGKSYYIKGRVDALKMIAENLEKRKGQKISADDLLSVIENQIKTEKQ